MNSLLLAIYVMGYLGSLRALNFILVEISTVCIFSYSPFWVYNYNSFRSLSASFWISSRLYSSWISSVAWIIFFIAVEEKIRMRAVYFNILLKGCSGTGISFRNSLLSFAVKRLAVFFFCEFILASWGVKGGILLFCVSVYCCVVLLYIKP